MRLTPLVASLLATGCATYAARPLDTVGVARGYHERRLDDSAVVASLVSLGSAAPLVVWHDWELAQAAWVLRPERARLRAEIRVADAARVASGARPLPEVMTETEYSFSGSGTESRWGVALRTLFTLELGGKRSARVTRANTALLAAIARAETEAWQVRWRVREALTSQLQADSVWQVSSMELSLTDSLLALMRARYEEGSISRSEVARVEADRQEVATGVAARRREVEAGRATLAERVGVSLGEIERLTLAPESRHYCAEAPPRDSLEQLALGSRRDLLLALAEYQVAEGDLRVEVHNSWPNLALGPGLFFDHGVGKWTVAFGLPSLPLHANHGPILEAEARRELAARRVAEAQEQVLGDIGVALAACASAREELGSVDIAAARQRVQLADEAYQRGEIGRLDTMFARLELTRAERRLLETGSRLQLAGAALEHAAGLWVGAPTRPPEKGDL